MNIKELNHVALKVADVEKSVEFYGERLGFVQIPRPAFSFPGAWFLLGERQELHLIGDRQEPVFAASRGNHFALQVDSIVETEEFLKTRAIDYRPPKQRPDGMWQIFVEDPDGYFIEFTELPDQK